METRTRWQPSPDSRSRGGPASLRLRPCALTRPTGAEAATARSSTTGDRPTRRGPRVASATSSAASDPSSPSTASAASPAVERRDRSATVERPSVPVAGVRRAPRDAPEDWRAAVVVVLVPLVLLVALTFAVPDVPGRGLGLVVGWVLLALLLDRHGVERLARRGARPPSRSR